MSKQQNVLDGAAKVWCCWNGTSTAAIRDSLNTSSLTDNGTGHFTISFTSSYSNDDYVIGGCHASSIVVATYVYLVQPVQDSAITTSSVQVYCTYSGRNYFGNASSGTTDKDYAALHSHGDLA